MFKSQLARQVLKWNDLTDMLTRPPRKYRKGILIGFALRFDTIAVCIKNKMHTDVLISRFLIETAISLLFLSIGCTDGYNIPLTKTYFACLHDDYLLITPLHRLNDTQ